MTAVDLPVAGAELKARQRRIGADVVDRSEEAVDVDAVDGVGDLHGELLVFVAETVSARVMAR